MASIKIDPATLKNAVDEAFKDEGYIKQGGARDLDKMRQRAFSVLSNAKVLNKRDRAEKSVTKGSLVQQVFPELVGPPGFKGEEDADLAEAVWDEIQRVLWGEAKPDATGRLQILIGAQMGNGYVLCRTKVGNDRTDAVYITDDRQCIEEDFIYPEQSALERKIRSITGNRMMLISRQPHNAKRYKQSYDHHMKALTTSSSQQLTLALEGVTSPQDDVNGEDDED